MNHRPYAEILQELSRLEDPYELDKHNLLALGITAEHIPDLIDTLLDDKYYLSDDETLGVPNLFAYVALGQLKTPEAIDGLILGVQKWAESDWFEWFTEAMPELFTGIGPSAVPALVRLLHDSTQHVEARICAVDSLMHLGAAYPEAKDGCIAGITAELEKFADNEPMLNAFLVDALTVHFKVVEAAPLIEAAYAADKVDEALIGDWDDAQFYLGLKEAPPERPERIRDLESLISSRESRAIDEEIENFNKRLQKNAAKTKKKRKQQKESRRKNRRK